MRYLEPNHRICFNRKSGQRNIFLLPFPQKKKIIKKILKKDANVFFFKDLVLILTKIFLFREKQIFNCF
jgi:hypothetical protein